MCRRSASASRTARAPATAPGWMPASPITQITSVGCRSFMSDLAAAQTVRLAPDLQAPFRVLVVDDDPDMAGFLVRLLVQQGLQADTAGDGAEALAKIAASPPDLVL